MKIQHSQNKKESNLDPGTDTQRRWRYEHGERNWNDAATNKGKLRITSIHQKLGRSNRRFFPKVFPVVMYGCESWTIGKGEHFWTVVLEKTLENPLDYKEIKPVNPKGNKSWIFIRRLLLKLKLQYFGHLMWKNNSLERFWYWEIPRAGEEGGDRG